MYITKLTLRDIRCFENEDLNISKNINLFIGKNNCGKSTILKAIGLLQDPGILKPSDARKVKSRTSSL